LEKSPVRKHWECGGGEKNEENRQTHRYPLLYGICKRVMKAACSYSPYRLRMGRQHQQQNSNLIEKITHERPLGMGGKKMKKNRQTHRCPLLSGIHKQRMAAVGSYSPCRPRKGHQCQQQNTDLIEKLPMRKHWEWEGI
jgi:hypothetical protein